MGLGQNPRAVTQDSLHQYLINNPYLKSGNFTQAGHSERNGQMTSMYRTTLADTITPLTIATETTP